MSISTFVRRLTWGTIASALYKGLCRALAFASAVFCVALLLDRTLVLSLIARQAIWLVAAGGALGFLLSGFFPIALLSVRAQSRTIARRAPALNLRSDELCLALDLSNQGNAQTNSLMSLYLSAVLEKLRTCSYFWGFPRWNVRFWSLTALLSFLATSVLFAVTPSVVPLGPRLLFPFSSQEVDRWIRVEPGDAQVPRGKDVDVRLTSLVSSVDKPALLVKAQREWKTIEPEHEESGTATYQLKNLVEPVSYRVLWKNEKGRVYTLTPVPPLTIESFSIRIEPPAYLKRDAVLQTSPEIAAPAGAEVDVTARVNEAIASARWRFSDGREKNADVDGKIIHVRFAVDQEGTYVFLMKTKDNRGEQSSDAFPVKMLADQPPEIHLLSPDQDLVTSRDEKIPLTYDVRDDYGVTDITLVIERANKKLDRRALQHFERPVDQGLFSHEWNLREESFHSGDVIRYQLEAVDSNRITGPGRAVTPWRVLEIAGFEEAHAAIDQALEQWRDMALETLAQVNTLQSKISKDNADLNSMKPEMDKAARMAESLDAALKQILRKMENDPMVDTAVYQEHNEIEKSLSNMNQSTVKDAQAAFQTQNKPAATSELAQMSSELERLSALSEDLSKSQHARDVLDASDRLDEKSDDMMNKLEQSGDTLDKETQAELQKLMQEAMKDLNDMAQSIMKNPGDLPEDFVNQEAMKDLNLDKSQDMLSQLSEAIKSGDKAKALALAKQFREMARRMKSKLAKAHESFVKEHEPSTLAQQIKEEQQKLEQIADEQREVLAETQKLDSKRLQSLLKDQDALLKELAALQQGAIDETQRIVAEAALPMNARTMLQAQVPIMQVVLFEFQRKQVREAPQRLDQIISIFELTQSAMAGSSSTVKLGLRVGDVCATEESIREKLKKPMESKPDWGREDNEKFQQLSQRQSALDGKLGGVKKNLQDLSRKTASLGNAIMESLSVAGQDMRDAAGELGKQSSFSAQKKEESALAHLLDGLASMDDAQNMLQEMGGDEGGDSPGGSTPGTAPGGGRMRMMMRGGQRGEGTQINKVRLPRADDYRPPKEIREEILNALKEKYPKTYESIIHKYFKRLAE